MTHSKTIQKFLDEVERLDREATSKPWVAGTLSERPDLGLLVGPQTKGTLNRVAYLGADDVELMAHYRTAAPRLARALKVAMELLENVTINGGLALDYEERIAAILSQEGEG